MWLKYSLSQAYSLVRDILPSLSSITVLSSLVTSVQTYPVRLQQWSQIGIFISNLYSPSSRLVHYYRHPLLLDLTHEAADHPAGLHGAVEPGRLPHLLSPGHRDARARLLKLHRLNISKKLTKFPYKCQKIPLPHHFFKKIQDGRFPRDRKELGRIVFVLKRRTTNYCSLDIYSSTTDLALADFQF